MEFAPDRVVETGQLDEPSFQIAHVRIAALFLIPIAHRHTWQTPLHGVRTDWNLLDYMTFIRGMYCVCYEPEDAALANWVGALEALDSGITTLVDHSHLQLSEAHSDALAEGMIRSGIRGIFCCGTYRNLMYQPGAER